jgi:hypothetical protein
LQTPREGSTFFHVDESGDPTFYGKGGDVIVGQPGCSRVFLLGFVECQQPEAILAALRELHDEIAADPYLEPIPSISKTLRAFHAKDDCPEVRMLVFRRLAALPFTVQVVVARKLEPMFRTRFQGSADRFYDDLVRRLFENRLHRYQRNVICFARRGKKERQHALRAALEAGVHVFRTKWKSSAETAIEVRTSQPEQDPLLQVVDYANWAVYRAFERGEMRFFEAWRNKYELVVDVFDKPPAGPGRNWYTRERNPFAIEKASPLG